MKHTIEGRAFCITGTLSHYTRRTAEAAIEEAGGVISKSVTGKTDFLVCGSGAGRKYTKAMSLGIPVIAEADLESFLAGDVVEVDEEVVVSGDASVRDLIGEARAALDGHPDSAMWTKLVGLVDSCALDQLPALVDFLEPQVARWQPEPYIQWTPGEKSPSCDGAPRQWLANTPRGELRVAPFRWITEMITGHDSPKQRLIRAVHVNDLKLTSTNIQKILARSELVNLTSLDLHETPISKTFWKKLRVMPSARTLAHLRVSRMKKGTTEGALGEHGLESLERLSVYSYYHNEEGAMATLFGSEMASGIRELVVEHCWLEKTLKLLDDRTRLPNLERIVLDSYYEGYIRDGLKTSIVTLVPEVSIALSVRSGSGSLATNLRGSLNESTKGIAGPELLDLSRIRIGANPNKTAQQFEKTWLTALKKWTPPTNTTSVRMGRYWTEDIAEALRARGLEPLR